MGNLRGQANCIFNLGNIAFARSQHGDARARFEEALSLYRQAAYVVGEANCIFCFGQIALERSELREAQARFESVGAVSAREGCPGRRKLLSHSRDLGLRRSKLDDARARFEQARPLFDGIGNVIGKANCLKGLGEIAIPALIV